MGWRSMSKSNGNGHTRVPCNFCHGTGQRELGPENLECLKALRSIQPATAKEIQDMINSGRSKEKQVEICAVHLRLRRMLKSGLVQRKGGKGEPKVFVEV